VIQKLRKKLIFVLMTVICLFIIGMLISLFVTAKNEYERRSYNSLREPPARTDMQTPLDMGDINMPIAIGYIDTQGNITVVQNQLYYVTEEELTAIMQEMKNVNEDTGITSAYSLRYRRHANDDGSVDFFFTDTYAERNSLSSQIWYSIIIGVGAIGLFFFVSIWLSRWMVKPVERAWEKQRQFVADASHELKTPLTVVLSNVDMMITSGAITDEKNKKRIDNIRAESQRIKGLVENLLTLARSDSTPALAARIPVNFSFIVTGATLSLEAAVYDMGRTMDCQIEDNLTVLGDGNKLRQLIDILLDNACKYSNKGSPIRVSMSGIGKKELLLTVVSEGAPLPPEECKNIFERFYRSDKSRGEEKGYGLGLAIAQSIVAEHGGRIWAQSDGVKLNTFSVRLPCVESAPTEQDKLTPA
jgi:two-component system, OmpR family, sensor histidine kinase CiaH